MRKGEKLLEYLAKQENTYVRGGPPYGYQHQAKRLQFIHTVLENIPDEEFDRIINDY